ncbi:MAG: C4-dicarboxylic acid transporter DauA [Deltaproteobacteria bacterium]|nr:MAG: C4-dicarboxylic acid transporter DauA [Deltaproteobacteria bacterium]
MGRTRYTHSQTLPLRQLPGSALRAVFAEGYSAADFRHDALAGLVVGIVALPLSMALAIAVGVPPQHGLYTAIVAGIACPLLGGSRFQVTGPTAAFIVILAPILVRQGLAGLLLAGGMAGVLLLTMGLFRLGRLIQFIPHPVTTGFTAGIGTVIGVLQLKDLLGLTPARTPDHFLERVWSYLQARNSARGSELFIGLLTLAVLVLLPRWTKRIPAPLIALPLAAVAAWALHLEVATIGSRFVTIVDGVEVHGIPRLPPLPVLPWHLGAGLPLRLSTFRALFPSAIAIAMLGAIESLLSAVVADAMAGTRHDPDSELMALGVGNLLCPLFGGIACTGAIARTATGIRYGSRSPIATIVHAAVVLLAVLLLAPLISFLPMAALAALLVMVAWNMSEARHFAHMLRVAPKSDVAVLLACYGLTVVFDMVVAVTAGMVLAAFLFMRRMAEVASVQLVDEEHPHLKLQLPREVMLYEVNGPLFFGAAESAMDTLKAIGSRPKVLILYLGAVPAMDVTGLVALESALARLRQQGVFCIIAGLRPQPASVLKKAGVQEEVGRLHIVPTLENAAADALAYLEIPQGLLHPEAPKRTDATEP